MGYDFSSADRQTGGGLIPEKTIVPVQLTVRPGHAGEGGWLRRASKSSALLLDCEFVVVEGEYAKRRFWQLFTIDGETEGQLKAVNISRTTIRAILESARGIEPSDESPEARAKRGIETWEELNGLRFWVGVGIEKGGYRDPSHPELGTYSDKNKISWVITPDRKEWSSLAAVPFEQSRPATKASKSAPVAAGRCSWVN